MTGTAMRGDGSGAILEALPIPLDRPSNCHPPTFAGPGAIPLIGHCRIPRGLRSGAACGK